VPSESHKSIQFIDLKVVDPTVNAVHAFQNQGDVPQVRSCWGAFEDLALNDGEISSLDGEDTSMVDGNLSAATLLSIFIWNTFGFAFGAFISYLA
jgi:hypothetical protein